MSSVIQNTQIEIIYIYSCVCVEYCKPTLFARKKLSGGTQQSHCREYFLP